MEIEKCWVVQGNFGDSSCPKLKELVTCYNCNQYSESGRILFDRPIPPGLLQEWTEIIARPKEVDRQGTIPVVVFRIMNEWFCLSANHFQSAIEDRPIHTIPFRTNNIFLGITNINGELLLCISLRNLLGIEEILAEHSEKIIYKRMIIIQKDNNRFVLPVDEILGVTRLEPDEILQAPASITKYPHALSAGVFNINELNVDFLDDNKLFESLTRSLSRS